MVRATASGGGVIGGHGLGRGGRHSWSICNNASLSAALGRVAAEKDRANANYREARDAFRQMLSRFDDRKFSDVPRAIELAMLNMRMR